MSAERMSRGHSLWRAQRGLSIIELMVGMVVALLVGLAASGSAIMFTASQRQGISAGGSAVSSSTVLTALKSDAELAGLGFFGEASFLCDRLNLSNGTTVVLDNASFSPVRITKDGSDDQIDLIFASRIEGGANVLLAQPSDGTSATLSSYLPVSANEAVLLAPPAVGSGGACVVRTVTKNDPSASDKPQVLTFASAATAKFNQAAFSIAPTFAAQGRVSLLGDLRWHRYRRVGNTLTFERPLDGDSAVIADNVVALRAQYGVSANATSTSLTPWRNADAELAALDSAQLPRVLALRIGMVVRSTQREKTPAGDTAKCESTPDLPKLFDTAITPDVTDWKCYRYRTSIVVVPLRNVVYGVR